MGEERDWQLAQQAREHAKEPGVTYVLWDGKISLVQRDRQGWRGLHADCDASATTPDQDLSADA